MTVELNHTIVNATDQNASARLLAEILGLPPPQPFGPFHVVQVGRLSLDFADAGRVTPQHYAFLVGEDDFEAIFGRIRDRGLDYWADPFHHKPGEINTNDGGRGVYWNDPDGHILDHHPSVRKRASVKLSISLTDYAWPQDSIGALNTVAREADSGGLDTIFVPDHLVQAQPGLAQTNPMFEAFTTSRLSRGAHASGAPGRDGGRGDLPLPRAPREVGHRTRRPLRWARLVRRRRRASRRRGGRSWARLPHYHRTIRPARRNPADSFAHVRRRRAPVPRRALPPRKAHNRPNSVQRPHPPIIVGGMGERRTLRLVARYADACNLGDVPDGGATISRKLGVLATIARTSAATTPRSRRPSAPACCPARPPPNLATAARNSQVSACSTSSSSRPGPGPRSAFHPCWTRYLALRTCEWLWSPDAP